MKNFILTFLIMQLFMPALLPWLPHGSMHALHNHQEKHSQSRSQLGVVHGHAHLTHDHKQQTSASKHHPIKLDISAYFSDYLHVDLQLTARDVLTPPAQDGKKLEFTLTTDLLSPQRYKLASVQNHPPPDRQKLRAENTSLFLSTQRLRI